VPTRGRAPVNNPGLLRTGSPTMRAVEPSPEPDERDQLPSSQAHQRRVSPPSLGPQPAFPGPGFDQSRNRPPHQALDYRNPSNRPLSNRYPAFRAPRPHLHPLDTRMQQQPHTYSQAQPLAQPYYRPLSQSAQQHRQSFPRPPQPPPPQPQPPAVSTAAAGLASSAGPEPDRHPSGPPLPTFDYHSPSSARTVSTASSLLAKRLGTDRAVGMALAQPGSSRPKWHRNDGYGPGNDELFFTADPAGLGPYTPRRPGDLPSTPTWVPRLTPTRRGDDLYLNVQ
jgi:hypothetical protein